MATTPPGYSEALVKLTLTGMSRPAYITWGLDTEVTDPVTIAGLVMAAIQASSSLKSVLPSSVTIGPVTIRVGQDDGSAIVGEGATTTPGTAAGAYPSPNVAVLVHKTTARGGRRGRGRMFVPWGIAETSLAEDGTITSTQVTTLNTAFGNLLTQLTSNGVPMVLLHNPGLSAAGSPNLVTGLRVDPLVATQRRRLGR